MNVWHKKLQNLVIDRIPTLKILTLEYVGYEEHRRDNGDGGAKGAKGKGNERAKEVKVGCWGRLFGMRCFGQSAISAT